jgi:hypothetical protein
MGAVLIYAERLTDRRKDMTKLKGDFGYLRVRAQKGEFHGQNINYETKESEKI